MGKHVAKKSNIATPGPDRPGAGVFDAFAAQVAWAPGATALFCGSAAVSYQALYERAEALARMLRRRGVSQGDFVALYASRGTEAIAGMLACLRAGAAYVPLDPGFASEQLTFIAGDLPFTAVLASPDMHDAAAVLFDDVSVLSLAGLDGAPSLAVRSDGCTAGTTDPWPALTANAPACVLYTSGTTGRPKGVVLPQRAITSMALDQPLIAMRPGDVALHATTIACDGALYDIMVPLLSGAAVAVIESATPSLDEIAAVMVRHGVTVPSWYAGLHHLMIDHRIEAFATVRMSIAGGDVMSVPHAEKLLGA